MKAKNNSSETVRTISKPYEPTPRDLEAAEAFRAAESKRGPRLKVTMAGNDAVKVDIDHPDIGYGQLALMKSIGAASVDFFDGLILQLVNASKGKSVSEKGTRLNMARWSRNPWRSPG